MRLARSVAALTGKGPWRAWAKWRDVARRHSSLVRAATRVMHVARLRALHSWREAAAITATVCQVMTRLRKQDLLRGYNTWRLSAGLVAKAHTHLSAAARSWRGSGRRRAWLTWCARAATRKTAYTVLVRVVRASKMRGFNTWRDVVEVQLESRRRVLQALQALGISDSGRRKRLALNSWAERWKDEVVEARARATAVAAIRTRRGLRGLRRWQRQRHSTDRWRRHVMLPTLVRQGAAPAFRIWSRFSLERQGRKRSVLSQIAQAKAVVRTWLRLKLGHGFRGWADHARRRRVLLATSRRVALRLLKGDLHLCFGWWRDSHEAAVKARRLQMHVAMRLLKGSLYLCFGAWRATQLACQHEARCVARIRARSLRFELWRWRNACIRAVHLRAAIEEGESKALALLRAEFERERRHQDLENAGLSGETALLSAKLVARSHDLHAAHHQLARVHETNTELSTEVGQLCGEIFKLQTRLAQLAQQTNVELAPPPRCERCIKCKCQRVSTPPAAASRATSPRRPTRRRARSLTPPKPRPGPRRWLPIHR